MKALKNSTWKCNGNVYVLVKGEDIAVPKSDEAQAIASGLFDKPVKPAKKVIGGK